ncbi:hypothetical protein SARC_00411 [Sphaeroforma arctica JP610]|uniref:Sulfatase N-terminal domain-containing protein n=1 Tax=Sphaeroforma arctica JP610 TaxID=667725 RepID=A0A0L0GF32_9EUKA|nr:hypothetical protein SARC_00411 [Sphaeroforma arctica JP610]KNC87476.1 hypothetical protein SARC_00411 [Sphaeroforma arctica JP610]|eukprot:XP_014161378.1 hypothetical protein SARC_00411 [Sphaeroforma arctica JP610]
MMIAFVLFDYGCKDIIESIPAYSSRYGSSAVHVVDNTILSSVFVPFKWGRSTRLEILKIASDKQPVAYKSLLSALESSSVLGTGSCLDRMVHGYMGKKVLSMRNEDIRPNVIVFTIETMRAYENSGLRVPMYNGTTVSLTPNLDRLRSRGADWRNFYTVNVNSPGAYYAQEHGHYNDGGGHTYDERLHGYTEVLDNMGYEMYRLTPDGFASSPGYQKVPYPNKVTAYLGEWGGWFTSKDILLKHPMVKAISKHKKKHGDDPYYLEVRTPGGTHIMWQLFEDSEKEFSEEFTAGLEQLREKAMNEVFPTADGVHHKDYYKVEDKNELYRDMLKTYWLADQFIGKTLDDLRAKGLAKNTLVIVQGDHGHGLEHGVATVPMREQYHVPFVVSDVDDDVIHSSTRNITNKEVSSNLDFGATLLDLLNAPGYVTDGIGHSLNRKMNSKGNKRHIVSRHGGEWIVRNQTHTMNFYPSGSLVDIKVWDTSIDPYQQYAPHVYSVPNTDDIHLHWLHTYREMSLLWEKSIESCGQHFNQTPTVQ